MRSDEGIARGVEDELRSDPAIGAPNVAVTVRSGVITLRPRAAPTEIKRKIEEAYRRIATIDAARVAVGVSGGDVILRGTVRSWAERREAEEAASAAPGVTNVENRLSVSPEVT